MTPAPFLVVASTRFERDLKALAARHRELAGVYAQVIAALREDPHNVSWRHPIKKLVHAHTGRYRIRGRRFRFRYDIAGHTVQLHSCGLRDEHLYERS